MIGRVKWFSDTRGFGFITIDKTEIDVFVHHSSILGQGYKTLSPGEQVEFDVVETQKGKKAVKIKKPEIIAAATITEKVE